MIREKSKEHVIDLNGPEGNAYVLLGYATRFARDLDLDEEPILKEMMSGDYENLIKTFDRYFGDYVILER
jgi:hypothetical protein